MLAKCGRLMVSALRSTALLGDLARTAPPRHRLYRQLCTGPHPNETFVTGTIGTYVDDMYMEWKRDPNSVHAVRAGPACARTRPCRCREGRILTHAARSCWTPVVAPLLQPAREWRRPRDGVCSAAGPAGDAK